MGVSKNLGQGALPIPQETVFGIRNQPKGGSWNARQCLIGDPTSKELEPDKDLGRCTKTNCMNQVRCEADENRTFGCPSIRTDIPMKQFKSVADHQNYGDEPEAIDILFPSTFTELGVTEYDFVKPREKEEIRALFTRIGFSYEEAKFDAVFARGN